MNGSKGTEFVTRLLIEGLKEENLLDFFLNEWQNFWNIIAEEAKQINNNNNISYDEQLNQLYRKFISSP